MKQASTHWLARARWHALLTFALCADLGAANRFVDPLDAPAIVSAAPAQAPVSATAMAGKRLVAVGMRGLIIASDDDGNTWRQMESPVQSDLTAVVFATPLLGWAVGHDGVILHSADGGAHWRKQLDGRSAATGFAKYYRDRGNERLAREIARNFESGPSLPYLDVWFETASKGYAVGSFGMIAVTEDGGNSWQPWLDRVDNPKLLNLNAIRAVGDELVIAGERGTVYRLDRAARRFTRHESGYAGSFFGIGGDARTLLAFGLRGNVYRSADRGVTWSSSSTPMPATVTAAALLDDGRMILATAAGALWQGAGSMDSFSALKTQAPDLFTTVMPLGNKRLLLGGMRGVQVQAINQAGAPD